MLSSPSQGFLTHTGMHLYQRRILALEKRFLKAERNLDRLLRQATCNPASLDRSVVKTQLDLINALIRLIKEETAFFVKLGQLYDFSRFCEDVTDFIARRDPDYAAEILIEMDRLWAEEFKRVK